MGLAVIVGAVLLAAFATKGPAPTSERFMIGTSTIELSAGAHSLWWQTRCHPGV